MGKKLYVGNLPFQTTEDELQELFSQAGPVESVRVMRDMATGRARGFAFVEMTTDEAAEAAINQFNEKDFGGRAPRSRSARDRRLHGAAAAADSGAAGVEAVAVAGAVRGVSRAGRSGCGADQGR